MRNIIILAFKNLTRHKKRTIITSIAIAFGIALLIWIDGMLKWADNESKRNIKKYEYGDFIVCTREYKEERKNFPVDIVIEKQEIEQVFVIAKKTGTYVSPRTGFKSMISFQRGYGLPYVVFAIDPQLDSKVFDINEEIVEGKYLDQNSDGILISSYAKKELGAGVGDYIVMETRTRYNTFQGIQLKVVGIFDCPNPIVNRNQMFISKKTGEDYLQLEGSATEIVFKTKNSKSGDALRKVKKELNNTGSLSHLTTVTWQELSSDYLTLSQTKKGGTKIIIFFIFIIVAVGIINTMLMSVFERVREIGMLRALGMRDRDVVLSFICEAAGLGIIGSLIGLILGIGLSAYSVYIGLDFTAAFKNMDFGYRTGTVFYNEWNPEMMAIAVMFGILCSILVSIIPARKAIKMEITDSIRYI